MNMVCPNCGKEMEENSTFCSNCGANMSVVNDPIKVENPKNVEEKVPSGTASLVCGIVGLFVAGIILGIIALVLANDTKNKNNSVHTSKSKAGFILGIIDIVGGAIAALMAL